MIRPALSIAALVLPLAATHAASDLSVLPRGRYSCWTAGSATGPATNGDPERSFTVVRGSSYVAASGSGTYLLAGDLLTFTRGPFRNQRLIRSKESYWQQVSQDGTMGAMKCSRSGAAGALPPTA